MVRREDENLAEENHPWLNNSFYASEPHVYLKHRFANLLLVAGRDEELRNLLDQGASLGDFSLAARDDADPRNTVKDDETQQRFVALESELLLHHAAETLLRLYVAHRGRPSCPWLELSRVRSFTKFKGAVREAFLESEPHDRAHDIADVFFGGTDRTAIRPPQSEEAWEGAIEGVDRFLVYYADLFLNDANLYNAAKHGLAVQPGEQYIRVDIPGAPMIAEGMALQFLEVKEGKWQQTVAWVQSELSVTYIWMAVELIEQLWTVGRNRYTAGGQIKISILDPDIHQVLADARRRNTTGPFVVETMSNTLRYNTPPPVDT